jgi:hypothetical protein
LPAALADESSEAGAARYAARGEALLFESGPKKRVALKGERAPTEKKKRQQKI